MTPTAQLRHELTTGLDYLAELVFRVAAATTDAPNAEIPGGTALYMTGPSADPEAFRNRELSILFGRLDPGAVESERPGDPPAVGYWLADWETDLRVARDDEPSWAIDGRAGFSVKYLVERVDWMLTVMDGELQYPPVIERAHELRHLIRRLEDCIHDGIRDDTGAPCELCGRPLVKAWAEEVAGDAWVCRPCDRVLSVDRYLTSVADRAETIRIQELARRPYLTAGQIQLVYGIEPATLRKWFERGKVRRDGTNQTGKALYLTADITTITQGEPA